jgi:hypothetical protein
MGIGVEPREDNTAYITMMRDFLSGRGFGDSTIMDLGEGDALRNAYVKELDRAEQDRNKGGSIEKKYAHGGSVRKTKRYNY